jgi:syntaxin-binding protein 5
MTVIIYVDQRISQESAELQSESENFASLAQQITKSMESKRWWNWKA